MLQSRGRPNLRKKALAAERRAELRVQHLDGHVALMLQIDRAIHGGHSACPELALDIVAVGERPSEAREDVGHRHKLLSFGEFVAFGSTLTRTPQTYVAHAPPHRLAARRR